MDKQIFIYYLGPDYLPDIDYQTPTGFDSLEDKYINKLETRNKAILEHQKSERYTLFDFIQAFNSEEISDLGWIAFEEEEVEDDTYTVITWPDVQELMDEPWFDEEAILDVDAHFGSSAYFIPTKRLKK